jgi:hypothetical protein
MVKNTINRIKTPSNVECPMGSRHRRNGEIGSLRVKRWDGDNGFDCWNLKMDLPIRYVENWRKMHNNVSNTVEVTFHSPPTKIAVSMM